MARKKIVAGNWKMNMTPSEAVKLVETLKPLVKNEEVDVVFCVPAIDIIPVVEAAKGTNLFFAIYKDENGKRNYETIPLNIVIENQKQGALQNIKPEFCSVPTKNEKGDSLLFHLSPNDLVYVPTTEEFENPSLVDFKKLTKEQINRIYKIVSFTGGRLYAIPNSVANSIVDKVEFTQLNKLEFSICAEKKSIRESCWKIKIDPLGAIVKKQ